MLKIVTDIGRGSEILFADFVLMGLLDIERRDVCIPFMNSSAQLSPHSLGPRFWKRRFTTLLVWTNFCCQNFMWKCFIFPKPWTYINFRSKQFWLKVRDHPIGTMTWISRFLSMHSIAQRMSPWILNGRRQGLFLYFFSKLKDKTKLSGSFSLTSIFYCQVWFQGYAKQTCKSNHSI